MIPVGRSLPKIVGGQELLQGVSERIAEYDRKVLVLAHKAERVLLCSPAGKLGKASKESEEAFNDGDTDKDGALSAAEVALALAKLEVKTITLEESMSMVEGGDADSDGKLFSDQLASVDGRFRECSPWLLSCC